MKCRNFIICGLTGWCIEVFFTAMGEAGKKDKKLIGHSSIWMFPIYGLASAIGEIYPKIAKWPGIVRALLYGIGIMCVEFASGSLLKKYKMCPWCYDGCKYSIRGLVRLDYLPLWMLAGMLYEKILIKRIRG